HSCLRLLPLRLAHEAKISARLRRSRDDVEPAGGRPAASGGVERCLGPAEEHPGIDRDGRVSAEGAPEAVEDARGFVDRPGGAAREAARAVEAVRALEDRVEMTDQEHPVARPLRCHALGEEVPGPTDRVGKRQPARREAERLELLREAAADPPDALEVERGAADRDHRLEELDLLGKTMLDGPHERLLARTEAHARP